MTEQGWGAWTDDRSYPANDGEHMITEYKREQRYGNDVKTFWKNSRRR